jgi:hypothetical protein
MSQYPTVIFLSEFQFGKRDIKRFGLEILKRNGISVEIWDISKFILKAFEGQVTTPDLMEWESTRYFSDEPAILAALNTCDKRFFIISLVDFNLNTLRIYQALSKNDLAYVVLYLNVFPAQPGSYSPVTRFGNFLKSIPNSRISYIYLKLGNEFLRKFFPIFGVKPATVALIGGSKALDFKYKPIDDSTKKVWLHSMDYDIYLEEKNKPFIVNNLQWVYIETYYPSDPDQFFCPDDRSFRPDQSFFDDLKRTFDQIERTYNVQVVIVEHPKKPHHDICDYGARTKYKKSTAEIVKSSAVVLSHDSTALCFAVLFNKPLLFLTSRRIESTDNGKKIQSLAHIFGVDPVFIDRGTLSIPEHFLIVNKEKYSEYISDYITNVETDLPAWQILADFLNKEYFKHL